MNASLLTADRKTHFKIVLVACLCSLGASVFAANHAVRHGRVESGSLSARGTPYRAAPYRTLADGTFVVDSLRDNPM